ncbi:MAG: PSD1 and planctomycete cytochrome C domain-containing protein [Verrucomicrobiota bacterium]
MKANSPQYFTATGLQPWAIVAAIFTALASHSVHSAETDPIEFFEKKIRPVLITECVDCHNAEKQKGGLRLDHREAWKKGGDSGASIVPGDPKGSLLLRSIRHEEDDLKMPSKAPKLDAAVIADFEAWVKMGAPDPRDEPSKTTESGGNSGGNSGSKWEQLLAMRRTWWSLQPVRLVEVPNAAGGPVHPVDRFLRVKQAEKGLAPAGPAAASAVLRRLSYVLTGLPPEPEHALRFETEYAADPARAVETAVDGFLASARFGEHWARHWMDLMRYTETHGSETDQPLPMAWQYRDYLVRAFNQNVPLDSLIREHLAGDLLPKPRLSADGLNESSVGPAHFRMVEHGENAVDTREDQVRVLDNQIDVVSKAFQGMTVACARCHDHKFDAISQRDYYALQGVFASAHMGQRVVDTPEHLNRLNGALEQAQETLRQGLAKEWIKAAERLRAEFPETFEQEDAWKQAFSEAQKDTAHPLHAWLKIKNENLPQQWEALRKKSESEQAAIKESNATHFKKVWDFREGQAEGWLRSGAGLEQKPEAGRFGVSESGDRLLEGLYPPALLSHWFSSRQHGIMISPAFTIETGRISVRAFGFDGLVRLVPDNYAVARRFNSKAVLLEEKDGWYMLNDRELPNPDRRKGQRARLEFVTREVSSIPVNYVKPPAPKSKPGSKSKPAEDSFFGVAEIVFHNRKNNEVPKLETSGLRLLLQKKAPASRAELAGLYSEVLSEAVEAWARHSATEDQVAFLNAFLSPGLLPVHVSELASLQPMVERYRALHREVPQPRRAPGLLELEASDAPLLTRGDHKSPADLVPRGYLEVLGKGPFQTQHSGRLELAEQIASAQNPLTARVMANRIWHWVYGAGIVPTVDNFGRMGEQPTHPELLEYLAARLVEKDWSLKEGLRFLLTTETFRSSSKPSLEAQTKDPANQWLTHMRVRRLEAEADMGRRSVYLAVSRSKMNPFLGVFDAPQPFTTFGRRDITTVPAQSLTLLNGPLATKCADLWSARVLKASSPQMAEERLESMFWSAFARRPTQKEARVLLDVLERLRTESQDAASPTKAETEAWGHLAHTLINLKEFIYLP